MKEIHFKNIDSTSNHLKSNYVKYENLTFVSADFQTNGHGRNNRKWESNCNENLLFSILIKEKKLINKYKNLSLSSAVVICEVLKEFMIENISIKWPNDVFVNDRKIAGVLLESVSYGRDIEALILGVGINVNSVKFGNDMITQPTSISLEVDKKICLLEFKNKVYLRFIEMFQNIEREDYSYLRKARNINYLKGKVVSANINGKKALVEVIDINDDNSLKVKKDNEYISLCSGEVSFHL